MSQAGRSREESRRKTIIELKEKLETTERGSWVA